MKNKVMKGMFILTLATALVSCGTTSSSSSSSSSSTSSSSSSTVARPELDKPTTIYLAGDSTVKTYNDDQYIGGWGQFLDLFLEDDVKVVNTSNGGRSSRSFINEGRLYNIDDPAFSYNFSQNDGNSIEDVIKEGDFLFIQFGHNDDASKLSNYSTIYDRMVPLGEKDANGIYPTTPATKKPTTSLPTEYVDAASSSEESKALSEIAKYGSEYYAYDSGGTYKWYLKQYIDFAREMKATPVLITPVARVKFSGEEIVGGPGLHGENFAYVEAVRQLADEEDCLLIDLFADSKEILETATKDYANYLMALKPNDLKGDWPSGYDKTYGNGELGYTGIEATHYNKYGAYLQAAKVAESTLKNEEYQDEYFSFKDFILIDKPKEYVNPSNLISKSIVKNIEDLFELPISDPNRSYPDPANVVSSIDEMLKLGEVTQENYLSIQELCNEIRVKYYELNIDDRSSVTNLAKLEEVEAKVDELIEANRPKPISTTLYDFASLQTGTFTENVVGEGFTIYASSDKNIEIKTNSVSAQYNGETYTSSMLIKLGGSAKYGTGRYIGFSVDKKCKVSIMCRSSGSEARTINIVDSGYDPVGSYPADTTATISSVDIENAGTYYIGSAGSGVYVYMIIIEYYE